MTSILPFRAPIQHTPGSWQYRSYEDGKPITNGKIAIAYMEAYEPEEGDGGLWDKETDANGNLIAAAPDLLECLQTILEFFNLAANHNSGTRAIIALFGNHDDSINNALQWRQNARTVIAKATGDGRST